MANATKLLILSAFLLTGCDTIRNLERKAWEAADPKYKIITTPCMNVLGHSRYLHEEYLKYFPECKSTREAFMMDFSYCYNENGRNSISMTVMTCMD